MHFRGHLDNKDVVIVTTRKTTKNEFRPRSSLVLSHLHRLTGELTPLEFCNFFASLSI